jgi:hypothetical protein
MKKISANLKDFFNDYTYFSDLNQQEEFKEIAKTSSEEASFIETNDSTLFAECAPIGVKATLKLFINPKNPGDNVSFVPMLAQHYLDVNDFTSKLTLGDSHKETSLNTLIKIILFKNNTTDIVRYKPTLKVFFSYFFFKRTVFKRKRRKVKKNHLVIFKRKSVLTITELLKGVCALEFEMKRKLEKNNVKSYTSSLKNLRVYLTA